MKRLAGILLFILLVTGLAGQEINHYDLNVKINASAKTLDVNGEINIDFKGSDSIEFVLWKKTKIRSIRFGSENAVYSFDTINKSPIFYIPDGAKLSIRHISGANSKKPLSISYTCDMQNVTGWAKSFKDEWTELGFYTAWYPVYGTGSNFTSVVHVSIDDNFKVSGSGIVTSEGKTWKIVHNWPVFDNVIIASKELKTQKIGGKNIGVEIVYTKFPEKDIDSVSKSCTEIFDFYSGIFGQRKGAYLKYAFNPLPGGGGYSRERFVSIKSAGYNNDLREGMAHEMGHFWWHKANATTWEDWLNEAFAECSMLLYIREKESRAVFDQRVKEYKELTAKTCPIWGVNRQSPEAYAALYNKGALILLEFEKKTGTSDFYIFLQKLYSRNITNTSDFLKFVETERSKDDRDWFEMKLKS